MKTVKLRAKWLNGQVLGKTHDYTVTLSFSNNGIQRMIGFKKELVPYSAISELAIETAEEASRRVTVTRLLGLGLFAFAVKKKSQGESFLVVSTPEGEAVYSVKEHVVPLRAQLSEPLAAVAAFRAA